MRVSVYVCVRETEKEKDALILCIFCVRERINLKEVKTDR